MKMMHVSSQTKTHDVVREPDKSGYRTRSRKFDRRIRRLEEEIRQLRSQMERGVQSEKSFTSELSIQLSVKLDKKINEYYEWLRRE